MERDGSESKFYQTECKDAMHCLPSVPFKERLAIKKQY